MLRNSIWRRTSYLHFKIST